MAKVANAVEILPNIWTAWVGRTNVTDDRQMTDGRAIAYSERSLKTSVSSSRSSSSSSSSSSKNSESLKSIIDCFKSKWRYKARPSCRRGTARRSMPVEMLSIAAQMSEK